MGSSKLLASLKSFESRFSFVLKVVCFTLMSAIVVDVFLAVLTRYALHYPLNWADQFAKYLLIWLVMLGSAVAMKEGAHIAIDVFVGKIKGKGRTILLISINAAVTLLLIVIAYHGFEHAWGARGDIDPLVFHMKMIYPYLAIPVGAVLMLVELSLVTIFGVHALKKVNCGS